MNVFLSWSGELSKAVAEALRDWLKCVLQGAKPWLSAIDIERGALWADKVNNQIANTSVGIVCLTNANLQTPWILFEAGALARGLSENLVCTLLIDLKAEQVGAPLSQFQSTVMDEQGLRGLHATLNGVLRKSGGGLDDVTLKAVFDAHWPPLSKKLADARKEYPAGKAVVRDESDILKEILATVQSTSSRVSRLESQREEWMPRPTAADGVAPGVWRGTLAGIATDFPENAADGLAPSLFDRVLTKRMATTIIPPTSKPRRK